jgi:hypothetical protein
MYLCCTASRPVLGDPQPPIQLVPGTLSRGVKRPGREVDRLSPSSDEVKNYVVKPPLSTRLRGVLRN